MAGGLDSPLGLARGRTGLNSGTGFGESVEEYRGVLAFQRLVKQVKRERARKPQRFPTDVILFPTERRALLVSSVSPFSALFLVKGLFGFSGLRGFSRSLGTSVERPAGDPSAAPSLALSRSRAGGEGGRSQWRWGFDAVTSYVSWTQGSCLNEAWRVFSQISVIPGIFLSKSVYFDSTLGFERQHALVERCV